ncbi:MAG: hypothetical protein JXR13_07085 [Thalassovita sp.]
MIVRTSEGFGNLADKFLCEQANLQGILSSRTFHEVRSQIGEHRIGEAIGDTETQRNDVAASAFLLVPEIAKDIGAAPEEILQLLVIAIMATATTHFSSFGVDKAQEMTLDLIHEHEKSHFYSSVRRKSDSNPHITWAPQTSICRQIYCPDHNTY